MQSLEKLNQNAKKSQYIWTIMICSAYMLSFSETNLSGICKEWQTLYTDNTGRII